jgi:hypothetical protein
VEIMAMSPSEPEQVHEDGGSPAAAEHLPDSAPRARMAPAEALERLRRGETLQHVRIDRLRFQGDFPLPVRLVNVTLVQPQFDGAAFAAEVVFSRCIIDRPHFNRPTAFGDDFSLAQSTLVFVRLRNVTVKGKLACDNVVSRGQLMIANSRFEGPVRFWEAQFRGWVELKETEFAQELDLRSIHADQGFLMTRCKCAGDVLFRGATVCKKWDGTGSRFEKLLDFSKAKLNDFVYLEAVEQGQRQRFAFANAVADRLLVRTAQLEDRLASELTGNHELAMREYALLKRCFAVLHRFDEEDWAYYRFKVNQRRSRPRSWSRPWTKVGQFFDWLLLDHGCGYGTNPYRAVRAAFLIIVLFGLIYAADVRSLPITKAPFEGGNETLLNRGALGLMTSISVFTAGLGSIRDAAHGIMIVPLCAEALLGTLLWGLFIVAFSRKVIR